MSLVVVDPKDEEPHVPGDGLGWTESYSFHVVEPRDRLAVASRMGVRPGEGIMDVGLDLLVADGGMLSARHVRPQTENTADLEVEGLRYEMVRPLEEWRITYDGPAHSLRSSRDAASHEAWHRSRLERLIVDLTFRAEAPAAAFGSWPGRLGQAGRFTGEVWVSGDRYAFDAPGVREKSWGEPGVALPQLRRRFWARLGDGSALVADRRVDERADVRWGWTLRGGVLRGLEEIRVRTETEPGAIWPRSFRLDVRDDAGDTGAVEGEVLQIAPWPAVRGKVEAVVCESVARFSCQGASGVGFAEYLHRLDPTGQPVLPIADWG